MQVVSCRASVEDANSPLVVDPPQMATPFGVSASSNLDEESLVTSNLLQSRREMMANLEVFIQVRANNDNAAADLALQNLDRTKRSIKATKRYELTS
jgi:hypothetical protein